jgi:CRP/FNR family transcriptional regulator, cyclic AMP receptor protein
MISTDQLKRLQLFHAVSPQQLERLGQEMVEKKFSAGDIILNEGQVSHDLYVIAEGLVVVQKKLDKTGDRLKVVARLGKEEFFGEMSFLENQPLSASVVAVEPTQVFVLSRQSLDALMKKDGAAAVDQVLTLLTGISMRLRRTTQELVTVFEVARLMGRDVPLKETMTAIVTQLQQTLGENTSVAFYMWNMFNDEYDLLSTAGASSDFAVSMPKVASSTASHVWSAIELMNTREGAFLYHINNGQFDSGARQLMETISSLLGPMLATARAREEDMSRQRLERGRQERFSL